MRSLPVLDELSRATKGDIRLGILRGTDVLVLQPPAQRTAGRIHAESLQHSTIPAHAAASGKALLAFSPPAVVDRVIDAGLPAFTPHTITSPEVLRQKLATVRLTQIASSRNEFRCGTAAIAMPIFYGRGRVAAAIELNVADLGNELKPAASALAVACRSLSRQLATELHVMSNGHIHHSEPTLHHHPNTAPSRQTDAFPSRIPSTDARILAASYRRPGDLGDLLPRAARPMNRPRWPASTSSRETCSAGVDTKSASAQTCSAGVMWSWSPPAGRSGS